MIFLIIIKNTLSKIEMPNTVLGDASRLIPDPLLDLKVASNSGDTT